MSIRAESVYLLPHELTDSDYKYNKPLERLTLRTQCFTQWLVPHVAPCAVTASAKEEFSAEPMRVWKLPGMTCSAFSTLGALGGRLLIPECFTAGWASFYQSYPRISRPCGFTVGVGLVLSELPKYFKAMWLYGGVGKGWALLV